MIYCIKKINIKYIIFIFILYILTLYFNNLSDIQNNPNSWLERFCDINFQYLP